jgi:hypothetical protein
MLKMLGYYFFCQFAASVCCTSLLVLQAGPGWLVAIKFADSPISAYSEVFYIPGMFKATCAGGKSFNSVQRIWVDSIHSQHAGRSIWGIPKV